jgi:hypothetical protein
MNLYKLSNVHAYIDNLFTISFTDIQGNTTGTSGDNLFFNQPIFNPELNFPTKVLPGIVYLLVRYLVHTILRLLLQVLLI